MTLVSAVAAGFARVAAEFATVVRTGDARLADARPPTAHSHDASTLTGTLSPLQLPPVLQAWSGNNFVPSTTTATFSATLGTGAFGIEYVLNGGNLTLNLPSGPPTDRQVIHLEAHATGAARTLTFVNSYRLSTGITVRAFTINNDQTFFGAIRYSTRVDRWVLIAATVSAN